MYSLGSTSYRQSQPSPSLKCPLEELFPVGPPDFCQSEASGWEGWKRSLGTMLRPCTREKTQHPPQGQPRMAFSSVCCMTEWRQPRDSWIPSGT